MQLMQLWIDTPLGPLLAASSRNTLYFMQFADREKECLSLQSFLKKTRSTLISGSSDFLPFIKKEIDAYFSSSLTSFTIPCELLGSPFQRQVWQHLQTIPFGETRSYSQIAQEIGRPQSYRAVARANSTNPIAILIPCHRVITKNKMLGGYNAGIERKKWLLQQEHAYI